MHRTSSGEPIRRLLAVAALLAFAQCLAAAGSEPASGVDGNTSPVQKPAALAYGRQVTILIKSTWTHLIDLCATRHVDVPCGKVVVHLLVDRDGKITRPRIISGMTGNTLSQISLDAVSNTELPAMPAEAIQELDGKRLAIDATFELLPEQNSNRRPSR